MQIHHQFTTTSSVPYHCMHALRSTLYGGPNIAISFPSLFPGRRTHVDDNDDVLIWDIGKTGVVGCRRMGFLHIIFNPLSLSLSPLLIVSEPFAITYTYYYWGGLHMEGGCVCVLASLFSVSVYSGGVVVVVLLRQRQRHRKHTHNFLESREQRSRGRESCCCCNSLHACSRFSLSSLSFSFLNPPSRAGKKRAQIPFRLLFSSSSYVLRGRRGCREAIPFLCVVHFLWRTLCTFQL